MNEKIFLMNDYRPGSSVEFSGETYTIESNIISGNDVFITFKDFEGRVNSKAVKAAVSKIAIPKRKKQK